MDKIKVQGSRDQFLGSIRIVEDKVLEDHAKLVKAYADSLNEFNKVTEEMKTELANRQGKIESLKQEIRKLKDERIKEAQESAKKEKKQKNSVVRESIFSDAEGLSFEETNKILTSFLVKQKELLNFYGMLSCLQITLLHGDKKYKHIPSVYSDEDFIEYLCSFILPDRKTIGVNFLLRHNQACGELEYIPLDINAKDIHAESHSDSKDELTKISYIDQAEASRFLKGLHLRFL